LISIPSPFGFKWTTMNSPGDRETKGTPSGHQNFPKFAGRESRLPCLRWKHLDLQHVGAVRGALVDELVDAKPGDFRIEAVEACQESFLVFPLESLASPSREYTSPSCCASTRRTKPFDDPVVLRTTRAGVIRVFSGTRLAS